MTLSNGQMLLHYRVVGVLGAGGMGEVYRAHDTRLLREVALKLLPAGVAADAGRLARFQREARALAALDHPNIVTVYAVEEAGGQPFITMALAEGRTLDRLTPGTGMEAGPLVAIATALADALAAAHARGVIHRDLKPGNIVVSDAGRVMVLDFGLARFEDHGSAANNAPTATEALTIEGGMIGTIPYMSPEQVQGAPVDWRTDIFSLGIVIYEMATGRRPFAGGSTAALASAILRDSPPALADLRPDLPGELDRLVIRCLAKDPATRPPAAEIRGKLAAIASGVGSGGSSPNAKPSLAKIEAVAVLPLTNLSGEASEEYFADGMTEALITDLAKVGGMKVISRTSVMKYKGVARPVGEIAAELSVDAVVEGSVLRVGDRVRISAQLIRAATDEHLWAERYDRKIEDVLALQDEVARAIARSVGATLKGPGSGERPAARKVDPDTYRLFLQGRHFWNMRTEQGARSALRCFRQVLDRDPTWSPAWLGMADALTMLSNYGFVPPEEVHGKALEAVNRALALDENSADAHRVLAFIRWQLEFDWAAGIAEYDRALELDPNSPLTTYWYGAYLGVIGLFEKSHDLLERAAELDPLSLLIPSVQGWVRIFARRFDEAVPILKRVLDIDPDYHVARWFLGEALVELGDLDPGVAELERALDLSGHTSRMHGYLGYAYGRAGRRDDARRMLLELERREITQYVPPYFPALVHAGLDEAERAMDRLEEAWRQRDTMLRDLKADPHWDSLHHHPRFQDLMAKMAFPSSVSK